MKRILFLLPVVLSSTLMAQEGSVGIGTQTPNEKAVLHLVAPDNDQGFLVPKLTTAQRNNFGNQLTSAENGMMVFDTDLNQFFFWLIDHWEAVGSSLQAGEGVEIVNGVINNTGDTDASDDFSGDWSDLANVPAEFSDGTDNVDDADNDTTNEMQDLNLSGDILTISGLSSPTQVDLSAYIGTNTDAQDLQFTSGQISLTGDPNNTIIDLSTYDTDVSDDFSGDWADLANVPVEFGDGTDDVDDADNDPANELQDLQLVGDVLTITNFSSPTQINLSAYTGTNTDEQNLQFVGDQITLTGDPDNTIIDLSGYDKDASDDFSGSFEELTDIPFYLDTDATDDFSGSFLDLEDVPVNLDVDVTDDFDGEWLSLANRPAGLDDGDDVDDADNNPNNEIQDLDYTSNVLTLSGDPTPTSINFTGWDMDESDDFSGEDETDPTVLASVKDGVDWTEVGGIPADFEDGVDDVDDADASPINEIQDLDITDGYLVLSGDPTPSPINLNIYLDNTDQLAGISGLQDQVLKHNGLIWAAGTDEVDDADASATNEIQDLFYDSRGYTLNITNNPDPTIIDLSDFLDNTDEQDLELTDGNLVLSGDPTSTPIDLSPYFDNTDLLANLPGNDGEVIKYSDAGGGWIAGTDEVNDLDFDPTNENQTVTAGTGINVNQTGQNFQVTNTSPDRTISFSTSGNVSVGGTYPDFSINVPTSAENRNAFKAGMTRDQTVPFDIQIDIVFDGVSYDLSGDYDPVASVFTAPVGGIYQFSGLISTVFDGTADLDIYIIKNGSEVVHTLDVLTTQQDAIPFTTELQLQRGEKINVAIICTSSSGGIVGKPTQTHWNGRLLINLE